jgi:hypothetical protein
MNDYICLRYKQLLRYFGVGRNKYWKEAQKNSGENGRIYKVHAKQKCSKILFLQILHGSIENLTAVKNMCALHFLNPFFWSKNWQN